MDLYKLFRKVNEHNSNMVNFISGFIDLLEEFEVEKLGQENLTKLVNEMNKIIEEVMREITKENN